MSRRDENVERREIVFNERNHLRFLTVVSHQSESFSLVGGIQSDLLFAHKNFNLTCVTEIGNAGLGDNSLAQGELLGSNFARYSNEKGFRPRF